MSDSTLKSTSAESSLKTMFPPSTVNVPSISVFPKLLELPTPMTEPKEPVEVDQPLTLPT